MIKKSLLTIFLCFILIFNCVASDQSFYISIPTTISNLSSVKEHNSSENFNLTHEGEASPLIGFGIGYYINKNTRIDVLFESLNYKFNDKTGNFQSVDDSTYTIGTKIVKRRVLGKSLKLNYYYDILHHDILQIFIGAGIGVVQLKENKSLLVSGHFIDNGNLISFPSTTQNANSKKTTNFTYSLMIGTSKTFNSIGHFDFIYSWRHHGKIRNNDISNQYKGHHFTMGVRFDL